MIFHDKNGNELNIGDRIIPDEGKEILIVSKGHIDEYENDVMFGQQVENMACFSILTQENLSKQWQRVDL